MPSNSHGAGSPEEPSVPLLPQLQSRTPITQASANFVGARSLIMNASSGAARATQQTDRRCEFHEPLEHRHAGQKKLIAPRIS
jgi:hypothetical protein